MLTVNNLSTVIANIKNQTCMLQRSDLIAPLIQYIVSRHKQHFFFIKVEGSWTISLIITIHDGIKRNSEAFYLASNELNKIEAIHLVPFSKDTKRKKISKKAFCYSPVTLSFAEYWNHP